MYFKNSLSNTLFNFFLLWFKKVYPFLFNITSEKVYKVSKFYPKEEIEIISINSCFNYQGFKGKVITHKNNLLKIESLSTKHLLCVQTYKGSEIFFYKNNYKCKFT